MQYAIDSYFILYESINKKIKFIIDLLIQLKTQEETFRINISSRKIPVTLLSEVLLRIIFIENLLQMRLKIHAC